MTGTMTLTCPLCGLRFAARPLLELHIREDHRPSRGHDPAPRPAAARSEVTANGQIHSGAAGRAHRAAGKEYR